MAGDGGGRKEEEGREEAGGENSAMEGHKAGKNTGMGCNKQERGKGMNWKGEKKGLSSLVTQSSLSNKRGERVGPVISTPAKGVSECMIPIHFSKTTNMANKLRCPDLQECKEAWKGTCLSLHPVIYPYLYCTVHAALQTLTYLLPFHISFPFFLAWLTPPSAAVLPILTLV